MRYSEFTKSKDYKGSQTAWHSGQVMHFDFKDKEDLESLYSVGKKYLVGITRTQEGLYYYWSRDWLSCEGSLYIDPNSDRYVIRDLLDLRAMAKKEDNYKMADIIRRCLKDKYYIVINDI
jgi:hypothetical protein